MANENSTTQAYDIHYRAWCEASNRMALGVLIEANVPEAKLAERLAAAIGAHGFTRVGAVLREAGK